MIFLLREIYFHDPLSTKYLTVQNLAFSWCQTLGRGDTRCRWYTRTIAAPKCSCRNELWYNRDFSPISMKKRPSLTLALVFQRYSKTNMTLTTWWNWNGAQELILKISISPDMDATKFLLFISVFTNNSISSLLKQRSLFSSISLLMVFGRFYNDSWLDLSLWRDNIQLIISWGRLK